MVYFLSKKMASSTTTAELLARLELLEQQKTDLEVEVSKLKQQLVTSTHDHKTEIIELKKSVVIDGEKMKIIDVIKSRFKLAHLILISFYDLCSLEPDGGLFGSFVSAMQLLSMGIIPTSAGGDIDIFLGKAQGMWADERKGLSQKDVLKIAEKFEEFIKCQLSWEYLKSITGLPRLKFGEYELVSAELKSKELSKKTTSPFIDPYVPRRCGSSKSDKFPFAHLKLKFTSQTDTVSIDIIACRERDTPSDFSAKSFTMCSSGIRADSDYMKILWRMAHGMTTISKKLSVGQFSDTMILLRKFQDRIIILKTFGLKVCGSAPVFAGKRECYVAVECKCVKPCECIKKGVIKCTIPSHQYKFIDFTDQKLMDPLLSHKCRSCKAPYKIAYETKIPEQFDTPVDLKFCEDLSLSPLMGIFHIAITGEDPMDQIRVPGHKYVSSSSSSSRPKKSYEHSSSTKSELVKSWRGGPRLWDIEIASHF